MQYWWAICDNPSLVIVEGSLRGRNEEYLGSYISFFHLTMLLLWKKEIIHLLKNDSMLTVEVFKELLFNYL